MENAKVDFKQIIEQKNLANTELIIRTLANGTSPLLKPSHQMADALGNQAAMTNTTFRGINDLLLQSKASEQGIPKEISNNWFTFDQAKELGAKVKKGEKGQEVLFYHRGRSDEQIKDLLKKLDELGHPHPSQEEIAQLQKNYIKSLTFFNQSQIDFSQANMEVVYALTLATKPSASEEKTLKEKFEQVIRNDGETKPDYLQALTTQIAKFIIVRTNNAKIELETGEENKATADLLKTAAKNGMFGKDEILYAFKEGSKLAQQVSPLRINNTLEEMQVNQVQKAFNFIKNNMKAKGKGYYAQEVWKELFDIEKETLKIVSNGYSADVSSERLDKFIGMLNAVQQSKTPFSDRLRAQAKNLNTEQKQSAKQFLNELRQSRNADNRNVAESALQKSEKSETMQSQFQSQQQRRFNR